MPRRSELKIHVRNISATAAVLNLEGRLTAGSNSVRLEVEVDGLVARKLVNLVINMRHVDLIDCAGIGKLLCCRAKTREQGGGMRLAHVNRRLRQLFELFRLDSVLEGFESERAAIASLPVREEPVLRRLSGGAGSDAILAGAPASGAV
ncbi:MAG: STAS domain-containing protein [bacterium]|nr:STAS domain-containing protein [bacterium]